MRAIFGMARLLGLAAWLLGLAGCAGSTGVKPKAVDPAPLQSSLGVGDVFEVKVYGEEELSASHRVSLQGTIDFPFVGRLHVAGLDAPQVADLISEKLKSTGTMLEPHVSVLIKESNSQRVNVVGAVQSPGSFEFSNGMTVVQAVSLAGGFTALANRNNTVVSRRKKADVTRFRVEAEKISRGQIADFQLQAGDIVYVPERVF